MYGPAYNTKAQEPIYRKFIVWGSFRSSSGNTWTRKKCTLSSLII